MKRKFKVSLVAAIIMTFLGLTFSLASAQTHSKKVRAKKTTTTKKPSVADLAQGRALISKADCLSCHKLDIKLVGPAYKDVAAKYPSTEANYAMLTQKVIAGGSGTWGQVAMAPHPTIAPSDVKKMVQYILSLK
jgi:cytochrome c